MMPLVAVFGARSVRDIHPPAIAFGAFVEDDFVIFSFKGNDVLQVILFAANWIIRLVVKSAGTIA